MGLFRIRCSKFCRTDLQSALEKSDGLQVRPTKSWSTSTCSLKEARGELVQIVSPVDPCVASVRKPQLVLDAVLFQQLRKVLGAVEQEVLVANRDVKPLDRLVD